MLLAGFIALLIATSAIGAPTTDGSDTIDLGDDLFLEDASDEKPYYFYHRLPYGSETLIHPIRLIVNGGFGITQFDNRDNRILEIDYGTCVDNVWRNLSNPIAAIEQQGWPAEAHALLRNGIRAGFTNSLVTGEWHVDPITPIPYGLQAVETNQYRRWNWYYL